jgi:putative lipoprotein
MGGTVTDEEDPTEDAQNSTEDVEDPTEDAENPTDTETSIDLLEEAGKGGRFFKRVFWLGVIVGAGVAVAYAMNQRQKLAAMSDDEIRAMLEEKLGGRVADEQLVEIQNTVISKVRGTSATTGADTASVTGTVTYREKIAMPQDAVVIVKLQDTSLMDVPAVDIGVQVIEGAGTVPVHFSVGFDRAEIIDNHTYTVRATITSGDTLLWTTDTAYAAITRGNPLTADLLLVAVTQPVSD